MSDEYVKEKARSLHWYVRHFGLVKRCTINWSNAYKRKRKEIAGNLFDRVKADKCKRSFKSLRRALGRMSRKAFLTLASNYGLTAKNKVMRAAAPYLALYHADGQFSVATFVKQYRAANSF